ncbi:S9 family peptidase [Granulicella sp. WH15]|uniref:S9 family peptidase n=1 Tax=Granulicella sp. WH15 TaxID=2602070 RepID=UPI0013669F4C|nr:S9 family peptidase [Granulicella sp. WH15]QHN04818.1 S9 family peptidase [Granulicella sp. WH15]
MASIAARLVRISAFALLLAALPGVAQSAKRPITTQDIFSFRWIGDAQLSPDGSRAVFVEATVNADKSGYETSLWIVPTDGSAAPTRLTQGPHDAQPAWSPDGSTLAFTRSADPAVKGGRPSPSQIFLLPLTGGEAHAITSLARGASSPRWSPDGKHLAFSSTTIPDEPTEPKKGERVSDVKVITQVHFQENGAGFIDFKHPGHLWVIDAAPDAKPVQLTRGQYTESDPIWSKDSAQLYFVSEHVADPAFTSPHNTVYELPIATPTAEPRVVSALKIAAHGLSLSPDGRTLAFVSTEEEPINSYTQPDLFTLDVSTANATPRNLTTKYDFDIGSGVAGDNTAPRGAGPSPAIWAADGSSLLVLTGREGSANLVRIDAKTGAVTEVSHGQQAVNGFTARPDWNTPGGKILALISTPVNIGDLFTVASGKQSQITHVNQALFSQLDLPMPVEVRYKSFDGRQIQAWVQRPPNFDAGKKYPMILNIHGGPHSAYGWVFDHEFQTMAARGYVVLYPNPRGSTTYGQEFGNVIQHKYPGDDFKDLMAGVDEVIKQGYVDPERLGVTGGSGGGLLTDWTVTQTQRFKAAVAQRDIADWTAWWYADDFTLFQPTWFRGAPFEFPEDFREHSPITYVKNVTTPMLFILGESDTRTPPTSGGEMMYRALKYRHINTVQVRFPRENHELSRSGEPWHRLERLEHIMGWMDKYLMGANKPEYGDAQ